MAANPALNCLHPDALDSPSSGIAFDVEISESGAGSPLSVPKRVRRRLLETSESKSRSPVSLEEIETKLKEADLRRQQFHEWLASKAKTKVKSPLRSPPLESLAEKLQLKLDAAEQKRLELLQQEQTRLAITHELRAAARTEVHLRAEREREELELRVESKVQQAESNRLALLEVERQRRAVLHERIAQSIIQRNTQEYKDKERLEALRTLICQKIAAAEEKRARLLKAQRTRAQALVLQARRVAKAVRRKREQESRKKKELLEARLQGAKRRRAEYLGQRGGCHNGHKMKKQGDRLCRKLTRCWRQFRVSRKTTLTLVREFTACNINQQTVTFLPFEELAARFTSPTTLRSGTALLARLEKRLLVSSASSKNIANIDHLLKHLYPRNKKVGTGDRLSRRTHPFRGNSSCDAAGKSQTYKGTVIKKTINPSKVVERPKLERYPIRVFLCAYMIIGHPEAVFSARGEREIALSEAASKLVPEFESLVSAILDGPPTSHAEPSSPRFVEGKAPSMDVDRFPLRPFTAQLAEFDAAWCSYLYQFVAWKVQDAQLLEEDLIRVACQLELSMLKKCNWTSENIGANSSPDAQAIQKQVLEDQQLLRERVLHLTGSDGVARMEMALSDARQQYSEAVDKGMTPPSPFASPQKLKSTSQVPVPLSEAFDLESNETGTSSNVLTSLLGAFDQSGMVERLSMEQLRVEDGLSKTAENERLMNEMLHEPTLGLFLNGNKTNEKLGQLQTQIKTIVESAFWDGILEGLHSDPPDYTRVVKLLREIRDELGCLVPESWKHELDECLDADIFLQILSSGSHDYEYFRRLLDFSLDIVLKLGAPARDCVTKASHVLLIEELSQIGSQMSDESQSSFGLTLVKGLRFILEQIQVLKADVSAARIQALAPIIQGSAGVEYLQKAFVQRYGLSDMATQACHQKLPKTSKWLEGVQQNLRQEREELEILQSSCGSMDTESSHGLPPSSAMKTGGRAQPIVISAAYSAGSQEPVKLQWDSISALVGLGILRVICELQPATEDMIAETLMLNAHRLRKGQNDYQRLIVMATGLLLLRQNIAARGLSGLNSDLDTILRNVREQLNAVLNLPDVNIGHIGLLLANVASTHASCKSNTDDASNADLMTRLLNRSLSPDDAVFKCVTTAIRRSLKAVILLGNGVEGLALVNLALQRAGVTCLQEVVVELGGCLSQIASVTCSIHGPYYASIVTATNH